MASAITYLPSNAFWSLSYALSVVSGSVPTWVVLSSFSLVTTTTSQTGRFDLIITATDSESGLSTTFNVILYGCSPTSTSFTPNPVSVSVLGPTQTVQEAVIWGADSTPYASCGSWVYSYSTSLITANNPAARTLSVFAPYGTSLTTFVYSVRYYRASNSNYTITINLSITVTRCVVTFIAFNPSPANRQFRVGIDTQPTTIPFGTL